MSQPASEKRSNTRGSGSKATPVSRISWKIASTIFWTSASGNSS
jgi:hypothetical protein